jgi:hypothetical protein
MYWDVIELKPEPDYCLPVRFKDGLAGRVRLRQEELWMVETSLRLTGCGCPSGAAALLRRTRLADGL